MGLLIPRPSSQNYQDWSFPSPLDNNRKGRGTTSRKARNENMNSETVDRKNSWSSLLLNWNESGSA